MRVYEIKRQVDGREERFTLRLVRRAPHLLIATYRLPKALHADGFELPRGGVSYGFFWARRPYIMYRLLDREGGLIANRFDVVDGLRIDERGVSYTDLLLDAWSTPDGELHFEDEDEVADATRAGLLSREQRRRIDRARGLIGRRHRLIAREAAFLLDARL